MGASDLTGGGKRKDDEDHRLRGKICLTNYWAAVRRSIPQLPLPGSPAKKKGRKRGRLQGGTNPQILVPERRRVYEKIPEGRNGRGSPNPARNTGERQAQRRQSQLAVLDRNFNFVKVPLDFESRRGAPRMTEKEIGSGEKPNLGLEGDRLRNLLSKKQIRELGENNRKGGAVQLAREYKTSRQLNPEGDGAGGRAHTEEIKIKKTKENEKKKSGISSAPRHRGKRQMSRP